MPYMDVKIVGSGGTTGMRKAFESGFDARMGAGVNTRYAWSGRQPEMPRGLAKVMDILANATMNSTPTKPEPTPQPGDNGQQVPPIDNGQQVPPGDTGQQLPPADTGQQVPPSGNDQQSTHQDRFCKK